MKISSLYGIVPDDAARTRMRCIFCGVFIPKATKCIEQHTNGTKHKDNIELMSENAIYMTNDVLYCKPCKRSLVEDESVAKHVEGDEHSTWMTAIEDLVDGEFIDLEPYLSCEKDSLPCEVCNCSIECTLASLEEHVNSFSHRANVCEKLKPLNGIFSLENTNEVWCKICDAYLENTVDNILDHLDVDDTHMEWFEDMEELIHGQDISYEDYLANEHEINVFCNKCQTAIVCEMDQIQSHIDSESHLSHFDSNET